MMNVLSALVFFSIFTVFEIKSAELNFVAKVDITI